MGLQTTDSVQLRVELVGRPAVGQEVWVGKGTKGTGRGCDFQVQLVS